MQKGAGMIHRSKKEEPNYRTCH